MGNIYDVDLPEEEQDVTPTEEQKQERRKRSKKRNLDLDLPSPSEVRVGKRKLMDMVYVAFDALEEAVLYADHQNAIKAAQIILDRAGFGPKTTVELNTPTADLSDLTTEQLAERAKMLEEKIRTKRGLANATPASPAVN